MRMPRAAFAALLLALGFAGCSCGVEAQPTASYRGGVLPKAGALRTSASGGVGFQGGIGADVGPGVDDACPTGLCPRPAAK
jgi:hypothetical protein